MGYKLPCNCMAGLTAVAGGQVVGLLVGYVWDDAWGLVVCLLVVLVVCLVGWSNLGGRSGSTLSLPQCQSSWVS